MKSIQKHQFEPVSLLTVENGVLDVAVIPAHDQPDWLIPKSLILQILDYRERIWTYLWQDELGHRQEVSVYHLVPKDIASDQLVLLEGNTDVHRLALQIAGEIRYKSVRISDVRDAVLPDDIRAHMAATIPKLVDNTPKDELDFMYESVSIDGELFLIPDLDMIAHRLVDLDS